MLSHLEQITRAMRRQCLCKDRDSGKEKPKHRAHGVPVTHERENTTAAHVQGTCSGCNSNSLSDPSRTRTGKVFTVPSLHGLRGCGWPKTTQGESSSRDAVHHSLGLRALLLPTHLPIPVSIRAEARTFLGAKEGAVLFGRACLTQVRSGLSHLRGL